MQNLFKVVLLTLLLGFGTFVLTNSAYSQSCSLSKYHGQGFTTSIVNVVEDCSTGAFNVTLKVEHNGCPGPVCRELSNFAVEAIDGTYSDISVGNIVGDFSFSSIETGNLGAQIPFNGIKVDGTSGLGDGMAGSFTLSYTLSELQGMQVSVKPGPNTLIVTFEKSDLEDFILCAATSCKDSVFNINTFPSQGPGTLAFEDLWPAKGDFDFNDMVVDYQFTVTTDSNNMVQTVEANFLLRAFGAGFRNGFGFQLPALDSSDIEVSGSSLTENLISLNPNGTEANQSETTIVVFDNAFNEMQHPGSGIGVNTDPNAPFVTPAEFSIIISFKNGAYTFEDLDLSNFKPFIFVNKDRTWEVHLAGNKPTDLADMTRFGTRDDASDPSQNRWFVTENNIPWAINFQKRFDYPTERTPINQAYLKFMDWAQSGGTLFPDWYLNESPAFRNNTLIYPEP